MKSILGGILIGLALLVGRSAGDIVTEWNDAALASIQRQRVTPPEAARALAILHLAIYDAVNSIERTHRPYLVSEPAAKDTSREAAAAQAGFEVLRSLFPRFEASFARVLQRQLREIPDERQRAAGIELGSWVSAKVLEQRRSDGASRVVSHSAGSQPGQWRPTPPDHAPALLPHWRRVTPFALLSATQFRSDSPPALDSQQYARDLNEVKDLGGVDSDVRTLEQTAIARFWEDGPGTVTPPGHWNRIAQRVAVQRGNSLSENARLFALLNMALADAAIACWETKYNINCWRPITAIQEADRDGNHQTQPDSDWQPLLPTPPFPSCTSGHSTFSAAAAEVLAQFYGTDSVRFDTFSDGYPGRRTFERFSQAAEEAGRSRIYGGIHFQFDNEIGLALGRNIGRFVFSNYLTPSASTDPRPRGASSGELANAPHANQTTSVVARYPQQPGAASNSYTVPAINGAAIREYRSYDFPAAAHLPWTQYPVYNLGPTAIPYEIVIPYQAAPPGLPAGHVVVPWEY